MRKSSIREATRARRVSSVGCAVGFDDDDAPAAAAAAAAAAFPVVWVLVVVALGGKWRSSFCTAAVAMFERR